MGYQPKSPQYHLVFADGQHEGLDVTMKSLPLGEFFTLQDLRVRAADDPDAARKVISAMADLIVSWNVEDNGEPVPPTAEGLMKFDMSFLLDIIRAWVEAVTNVPNHSQPASNAGATSLELSIPMERL